MKKPRRVLILTTVFALLFSLQFNMVFAHHFELLPQDALRSGWVPGGNPEMWTFREWYLYSIFYPKVDADPWRRINWIADASIKPYFTQAIADWSSVDTQLNIDWHVWRDATGIATTIHLEGKAAPCPGSPNVYGCFSPTAWGGANPGNSNRWTAAKIYINVTANPSWSNDVKRYIVAHELGHGYGLHERYVDNVTPAQCNNSETTIMDTAYASGGVVTRCDTIVGPTLADKNRVSAAFVGGNYAIQSATWNGTNLVSTWKDQTWNDWELDIDFYKWNGYAWVFLGNRGEITNTGAHQTAVNRTITNQTDVKSLWGAGYYQVCGYGRNGARDNGVKVRGNGTCLSSINVP